MTKTNVLLSSFRKKYDLLRTSVVPKSRRGLDGDSPTNRSESLTSDWEVVGAEGTSTSTAIIDARSGESRSIASLLPDDILIEIFTTYRSLCQESWSSSWLEHRSPYSFLFITHVCGRWRDLALATASFWTYIFVGGDTDGRCIQWMLEKSRGVPLTIEVGRLPRSELSGQFLSRMLALEMHRIREIVWNLPMLDWVHLPPLLDPPSLRSLVVKSEYVHLWTRDGFPVVMRSLQRYEVQGFCHAALQSIPITDALSGTLTTLSLQSGHKGRYRLEPAIPILSVLSNVPSLVDLKLEYITIDLSGDRLVSLPRLQTIRLTFQYRFTSDIASLLARLLLSPDVQYVIQQESPQDDAEWTHTGPSTQLVMELNSKFSGSGYIGDSSSLRRLDVHSKRLNGTNTISRDWRSIVGWDRVDDDPQFHCYEVPNLDTARLEYLWNDTTSYEKSSMSRFISSLLPIFPLSNLEIFRLDRDAIFLQWADTIVMDGLQAVRSMTKLRILALVGWEEDEVALLLSGSNNDITRLGEVEHVREEVSCPILPREDIPFPHLSALHLLQYTPTPALKWDFQDDEEEDSRWSLRTALRIRELSLGSQLTQLILSTSQLCFQEKLDISELQPHVVERVTYTWRD